MRMASEQAEAVLAALRLSMGQSAEGAAEARAMLAQAGDPSQRAARERLRAEVAAALTSDLLPSDHPVAVWLLAEEIKAHEARGAGASEALYMLIAAVARFAQPADALLLWRARQATPETQAGVDAEQFGRLGLAAVRERLTGLASEPGPQADEAARALQWLDAAAKEGAFDDLAGYFLWADERFGLATSGPT